MMCYMFTLGYIVNEDIDEFTMRLKTLIYTIILLLLSGKADLKKVGDSFHYDLEEVKFSSAHGPKIELLDNDTVARRYEGYCYSVAFSKNPLKVGQTLHFNISETETGWLANLNVGIIYRDPFEIEDLVTCTANITESYNDTRVFIFKEFYSSNNVYQFRIDKEGVAYLLPNVTADDVVFRGVDVTKTFWAIFNVFGDSKAIQLLGIREH